MTILFDHPRSIDSPALAPVRPDDGAIAGDCSAASTVLEIGLVNNMPDAALQATERQFTEILNAAAGERLIRLHFFSLPGVSRSGLAKARLDRIYTDVSELGHMRIDGLIVTGAEPRTASLADEPYWNDLTAVVDWAERNTRSTIWSCLAAHAAVLYLDGIERRPLAEKCSGIFKCAPANEDWLTRDIAWPLNVSHSRLNDLSEADLTARGYRILTRADGAGVDIFARQGRSQFIFFQGHPEYDQQTLLREYLRDISRFLAGERDSYPGMPTDYFDPATELAFAAFRARAVADRRPDLMADRPTPALRADAAGEPRLGAAQIYRNWLGFLAAQRAG